MTTYHETSKIVPQGENLRRAIRHVEEFSLGWNPVSISTISLQYDLSPLEEDFLIRQFVNNEGIGS